MYMRCSAASDASGASRVSGARLGFVTSLRLADNLTTTFNRPCKHSHLNSHRLDPAASDRQRHQSETTADAPRHRRLSLGRIRLGPQSDCIVRMNCSRWDRRFIRHGKHADRACGLRALSPGLGPLLKPTVWRRRGHVRLREIQAIMVLVRGTVCVSSRSAAE